MKKGTRTKSLFVVKYTDCYGNGNEQLEVIVESHEDFLKWLEIHNESRREDDDDEYFCEETEAEFELIPLTLFKLPK